VLFFHLFIFSSVEAARILRVIVAAALYAVAQDGVLPRARFFEYGQSAARS
jgi:hypothetical protein